MINIIVGIIRSFFVVLAWLTPLIVVAVIISLLSDTIRDVIKKLFVRKNGN